MDTNLNISLAGLTDVGKVCTSNEDCFYQGQIGQARYVLAMVVDGCGGHRGGRQAAEMTRDGVVKFLTDSITLATGGGGQPVDAVACLKKAMIEANNTVYLTKYQDEALREMCCVATAVLVDRVERMLHMAHVGDSRLYASHQDRLIKLSHDHSPVGREEELGYLSETEAMNHRHRNVIDRAVGHKFLKDKDKYIETQSYPLCGGLSLLLCSDGLSDKVTSAQMSDILCQEIPVEEKARKLVEAANEAGGDDNITVVLLRTEGEDAEKAASIMDNYATIMNPYKRITPQWSGATEENSPKEESPQTKDNAPEADTSETSETSETSGAEESFETGESSEVADHTVTDTSEEESIAVTETNSLADTMEEQATIPVNEPETGPSTDPNEVQVVAPNEIQEPDKATEPARNPNEAQKPDLKTEPVVTASSDQLNKEPIVQTSPEVKASGKRSINGHWIYICSMFLIAFAVFFTFRSCHLQKLEFTRLQHEVTRHQMVILQLQQTMDDMRDSIRILQDSLRQNPKTGIADTSVVQP